ncbi:MAG: DUF1294 domain-containing protein [Candidatus Heteroscillospira sp.]|jgi:uncharacterized membrane protein YsdA (DUF1294 family)
MKEFMDKLPIVYVAVMTLIAFAAMGWDKFCARRGARRISEKTLFLLAILGGSIGSVAGMYAFHHKTRHWYFRFGLPAILVLQIVLIIAVKWYLLQNA